MKKADYFTEVFALAIIHSYNFQSVRNFYVC